MDRAFTRGEDLERDMRLMYVALSRASYRLHIMHQGRQASFSYPDFMGVVHRHKDLYDWSMEEDDNPETYKWADEYIGQNMLKVIRFFLDHGFDVSKNGGRFGAQSLAALVLSTFDAHILEESRMLLDAGAVNVVYDEDNETVLNRIGGSCSFHSTCEHDHHLANIYEAFYQMVEAKAQGRPYRGIDSYLAISGKRIVRVLAEAPLDGPVFFDLALPGFAHGNCYGSKLFFEYDGGFLITDKYVDVWTDTCLPDTELIDVSEALGGIVDNCIKRISFGHNEIKKPRTTYGQPIIILEMETGATSRFTINFGEVAEEDRAAYFTLR